MRMLRASASPCVGQGQSVMDEGLGVGRRRPLRDDVELEPGARRGGRPRAPAPAPGPGAGSGGGEQGAAELAAGGVAGLLALRLGPAAAKQEEGAEQRGGGRRRRPATASRRPAARARPARAGGCGAASAAARSGAGAGSARRGGRGRRRGRPAPAPAARRGAGSGRGAAGRGTGRVAPGRRRGAAAGGVRGAAAGGGVVGAGGGGGGRSGALAGKREVLELRRADRVGRLVLGERRRPRRGEAIEDEGGGPEAAADRRHGDENPSRARLYPRGRAQSTAERRDAAAAGREALAGLPRP